MSNVSVSRVFQATPLAVNQIVILDARASHHMASVMRIQKNDTLTLLNGEGGEYRAVVVEVRKKEVIVETKEFILRDVESPLPLYLAQGISRGEKMDYTIQKAVELGAHKIIPLFTERSTVKLDAERLSKKVEHWQSIIISACEQSGRNRIPLLCPPTALMKSLDLEADCRFVLSPTVSKASLHQVKPNQSVLLLVGPEGGLSDAEIAYLEQGGFASLNLGPRVLRTETAAVAALAVLQSHCGDMI